MALFAATTQTTTQATSPAHGWWWLLIAIGVFAIGAFLLLFWFYKRTMESTFLEELLIRNPDGSRHNEPPHRVFAFAEEYLARRSEFWVLYAQFVVATLFIGAISGLILFGAITIDAGLPALSTVVGLVLGKTLLSAKGTPLSAQEQGGVQAVTNQTPPSVSASATPAVKGTTLTADPGEWSGQLPISYSYAWQRKTKQGVSALPGETSSTYTVDDPDLGATIVVKVTASNPLGTATAVSKGFDVPS
jgi:hypothetical protein